MTVRWEVFRIFFVLLAFFMSRQAMAQETPKWLYKGGGMPTAESTVAVVVAVDHYYNEFSLDDAQIGVKERGLAVAQELAQWEDISHIALINATFARKGDIASIVGGMPQVQRIVFVWIGLGIGNDFGQPRLLPSDVRADDLEATSLAPEELKELLSAHAKFVDIIVDASAKGQFASLALMGPDATAFESGACSSCWVLSATKGRALNDSNGFVGDFISVLAEHRRSQKPIGYGEVVSTLTSRWTPDVSYQGGVLPSDPFLVRPAPPMVVSTSGVTPLPITPPKVTKPLPDKTKLAIVLGTGGLVAGTVGVIEAVETARIHSTMDTDAEKIANYGGGTWEENDAALQKAEDARAAAGWFSTGAGIAAAGLLTAAVVIQF